MPLGMGILIGSVATFVLCYAFFLWVSASNSKRNERLHNELMWWHERAYDALVARNHLTRDTNELLMAIRDKLK